MALARVLSPESNTEIVAIVAMLEAHEIPCFVHNAGFGGLFPGLQINAYNNRSIMVPEELVEDALQLIQEYQANGAEPADKLRQRPSGVIRNLIELLLFGWFVPSSGSKHQAESADAREDASERSREG